MDYTALSLTLRLAGLTTLLLLAVSIPLAAWISGLTPFAAPTFARKAVHAAVALPLVLPPTVLGFYLLVGFGPTNAFGRAFMFLFGHPLAFTFGGLVVGSMIYSLPFSVQPLVTAFAAVDPVLVDTARVLGASPFAAFRRIVLPLSKQGLLTAAVLTFAHTVGEFGVVLMIGGDIPGITRTLSISIFDRVQEGNYAAANAMSIFLLLTSFLVLLAVYARDLGLARRWLRYRIHRAGRTAA